VTVRVGIVGAGALGGYFAAELADANVDVVLVHRPGRPPKIIAARRDDGTDLRPGHHVHLTDDPARLAEVDACIVAVKAKDTRELAHTLAAHLGDDVPVVSLQNGLNNATWLAERLGERATGGVVAYNVFVDEEGVRHQATTGKLFAGKVRGTARKKLQALAEAFQRAGDPLVLVDDIDDVVAGKLLLNLNNGICAVTGMSIAESLRHRDARWCFARCIDEGLAVMKAAGLRPARVSVIPAWAVALVMRLPDAFVLRVAKAMISVDARARSSTLQDLERGRETEIDELNGAIVTLAQQAGIRAPANAVVTQTVHEHEEEVAAGLTPQWVRPAELRARIEAACS
jgi:2-dehydropantoate 2-reductase